MQLNFLKADKCYKFNCFSLERNNLRALVFCVYGIRSWDHTVVYYCPHPKDMARAVCLWRFHVGGLSCLVIVTESSFLCQSLNFVDLIVESIIKL